MIKMNRPCWQFNATLLDPEGQNPVQPPPTFTVHILLLQLKSPPHEPAQLLPPNPGGHAIIIKYV